MFPSALSEGALYPENIIVGHPYNPSYLLPLIEICGPQASEETISKAIEAYKAMGKEPVVCKKEVTGFIVNSLSWGVLDDGIQKVLDGVCDVEDVDKAIMYGPGMRMAITGQLLTMSMGVQGGFRVMAEKYGATAARRPHQLPHYPEIEDGVEAEIANRPEELGRTVEEITKFRDKAFVEILKLQGKL